MKVAISLLLVVLVVSLDAFPSSPDQAKRGFRKGASDRFSHGFGKRMFSDDVSTGEKRGFKLGASDRFSHGFGKRTNAEDITSVLMTVEEMAALIQSSPKLAYNFVEKRMDLNDDGYISRDELLNKPAPLE